MPRGPDGHDLELAKIKFDFEEGPLSLASRCGLTASSVASFVSLSGDGFKGVYVELKEMVYVRLKLYKRVWGVLRMRSSRNSWQ